MIKRLTEEINRAENVATKVAKAHELIEVAGFLLSCVNYKSGNWNCEDCHRVASLRKEASQIILHVSKGDIELGLRKLTEAINQLAAGLLPSSRS